MDNSKSIESVTTLEQITCTVKQAAAASGLGEWSIWKLIKQGDVGSVQINGRTLVKVESLRKLLENGQSEKRSKRGDNIVPGVKGGPVKTKGTEATQ